MFTDQEVEDAGKGEPFVIPNARQKEMWHFLTSELGWDDYYAWRICFELWYTANREQRPNHSKELEPKDNFENEALSLNDLTPAEREKGLRLLADYMDHMPRLTLKGHAPAEL